MIVISNTYELSHKIAKSRRYLINVYHLYESYYFRPQKQDIAFQKSQSNLQVNRKHRNFEILKGY